MFYGMKGSEIEVEKRKEQLKYRIEHNKGKDLQVLKERLARFEGKTAVAYVGGGSEVEIHENRDKLVDSMNATKNTMKEGILPGGGSALLHASKILDLLPVNSVEE